jgi:hypothetical protein
MTSEGRERRQFSAADPDQVVPCHRDRVGVRAGVEVDGLDVEQAAVVDRAEAEEAAERRNGSLAQAGHFAELLVGCEPSALAEQRREQLPIDPPVGCEDHKDEAALCLHEHRLRARAQLRSPRGGGLRARRHRVVVGELEFDAFCVQERHKGGMNGIGARLSRDSLQF